MPRRPAGAGGPRDRRCAGPPAPERSAGAGGPVPRSGRGGPHAGARRLAAERGGRSGRRRHRVRRHRRVPAAPGGQRLTIVPALRRRPGGGAGEPGRYSFRLKGLWRSPVAHLVRIEGVRGSTPLSSTPSRQRPGLSGPGLRRPGALRKPCDERAIRSPASVRLTTRRCDSAMGSVTPLLALLCVACGVAALACPSGRSMPRCRLRRCRPRPAGSGRCRPGRSRSPAPARTTSAGGALLVRHSTLRVGQPRRVHRPPSARSAAGTLDGAGRCDGRPFDGRRVRASHRRRGARPENFKSRPCRTR